MVKKMNQESRLTHEPDKGEFWLNAVDALVLFYQMAISVVVATGNLPWETKVQFVQYHLVIFFILLFFLWSVKGIKNPIVQFVKAFYPLAAMLFFYKEIGF